ncbi:MAG: SDR family oxidoreductase [Chloroflexota bacterium]|nr:SDR family oxidoreductase [Chloroflexota bacterium]MDE2929373.1 SDR family oxidoreductase [Chloroflexota bacterium]
MRILVAGGAGFVGSHLCDFFIAQGHAVTALDSGITGRARNVAHLADNDRFSLLEHDVTEPIAWQGDAVFHLASPASPEGYLRHPIQTLRVNSVGTEVLLTLARENDAKFLFASTSEVYGDPLVHPQSETYWGNVNPVGPRACYDEGKRFGEALTMEYVRQYGVDARIIRIFNTYGPRNDPCDGRVVPNFIVQALAGLPITLYGDGTQTRSFCFVGDLVRGIAAAMFTAGTQGEVFNLGNPDERSIREFAELIVRLTGTNVPIMHKPLPADDPKRRRPDISKAKARLDWTPQTSLEEGVAETIAYFRQELATRPAQ